MKKTITTMSALLLLSATLAACNTDTAEPTTPTAAQEEPQTTQTETTSQSNTEQTTEQQSEENKEQAQANPPQTEEAATLTYNVKGETFKEETTISTSEEMNYTIAHFDNFTLQAEDPGIDQLIYNDDDSLAMQIEVVTKEDVTFEDIKASAVETMAVISPDVKELDFAAVLEHRTDIIKMAGYEALLEKTDKVAKIVFERDNKFVTLTIYDTVTADLQDAFLQMGLTIQ